MPVKTFKNFLLLTLYEVNMKIFLIQDTIKINDIEKIHQTKEPSNQSKA